MTILSASFDGEQKCLAKTLKCTELGGNTALCHFTAGICEREHEILLSSNRPLQSCYTFFLTDIDGKELHLTNTLKLIITFKYN